MPARSAGKPPVLDRSSLTSEYFFLSRSDVAGTFAVLRGSEFHHLARVLRARPGDRVWLFDEDGRRYRAEVVSLREREAESTLSILDVLPPDEVGRCVLDANRRLFRGDAGALTESIRTGGIRFHAGSIHGVLPQFPHVDNAA